MRDTPIIQACDADLADLLRDVDIAKPTKGKRYKKAKDGSTIRYLDIVCAFDIETSKDVFLEIDKYPHAWMYIWQFQVGDKATIIGRYWSDFLVMVYQINELLHERDARLMVYVHYLPHEFQFLSGIWPFDPDSVFATETREPLYCVMDRIEMRCSARLSGYTLEKWAENLNTDHQKLTGSLDYSVVRYPWTPLTDQELAYCVHDVICVVECVLVMLHSYGDTLNSIPYTATGYVRRRVKESMRRWSTGGIRMMQNDLETYDRLRNVFRGGDTHANRYMVGALLGDVWSFDRSSSYPDVIIHCKFPMSKFRPIEPDWEVVCTEIEHGRCVIMKACFYNIRLRDPLTGNPYIDTDHCVKRGYTRPINAAVDNGRILSADYLEIAITDIDLEIIQSMYDYDGSNIIWAMSARYGYLPQPLIDVVLQMYATKTALKDVPGKELEYQHTKQLYNSIYGMMCQRVISNPIVYTGTGELWKVDPDIDRQKRYDEAINHTTLNYAWAVWVTAWARYRLFEGVQLVTRKDKRRFCYCDTDSIKGTGELPDFTKYNQQRIRDAKRSGAYAVDPQGRTHYIGVFEYEGTYDLFRTLGAKRYCTVVDGEVKITTAGVPKDRGSKIIEAAGGIYAYDFDFVFEDSGKLRSLYNDQDNFEVEREGRKLLVTRNVVLLDTNYKMSISPTYRELLDNLQDVLDSITLSDYNHKW